MAKSERELSITETAAALGISSARVYQIINQGQLKTVRRGRTGRFQRITEGEINRYKAWRDTWKKPYPA